MKDSKDTLGDRMKGYESEAILTPKVPVIIRIDGKAFHTYTRPFEKPFDAGLTQAMAETTRFLCENIQGALCGYCQSDEISILVSDWQSETSEGWFGYNIQKVVSVSASMATAAFNKAIGFHPLANLLDKPALFDSRAFNVPEEDVGNYFLWRRQDCIRNSINALGQARLGHKKLQGKSQSEVLTMLEGAGYVWSELPNPHKYGSLFHRLSVETESPFDPTIKVMRSKWFPTSFNLRPLLLYGRLEMTLAPGGYEDRKDVAQP